MGAAAQPLDKSRGSIQSMFDDVAPRYDFLNRLLSARRDIAWRRKAARTLDLPSESRVLDLCCGTGDQAVALSKQSLHPLAADFSVPMVGLAQTKFSTLSSPEPKALVADSLVLPLPDQAFAAVTVSFGLRNVENLDAALEEIFRVLKASGRLVVLEFAVPANALFRRLYFLYFRHVLPRIGRLLSPSESAYQYLTDSVLDFPQRDGFTERLIEAGFEATSWRDLSGGIVCLYSGRRPG